MNFSQAMGRPRNPDTIHHTFRGVVISLYKNKRGDWEAGFTLPGQGRAKATGADERLCREAACAKIREALGPDEIAARSDEAKARELLKASGVTLTEAARFFLSEHQKPEFPGTVTQVRDRWLQKVKQKKGKTRYHHYRSSAQRTGYLEERFGDRQISTVSLAELTNLQDELLITRAGRTVRNIHDAMKAIFVFARKRGFLIADKISVAERLDRPDADVGKKGVFTRDEMRRLVDTAWGYAMPGAIPLAVVGFGSTRAEESCKQDRDEPVEHRIWWEDIIWAKDHINIRPEVSKTSVARHAGLPANLKAMLLPLRGSGPLYAGKRLDLAFAAIATKAQVVWKANGLRHSCITVDMLLAPNATEVANRSGNSVTMIERCYRNTLVTRDQAIEWTAIGPQVAWGSLLPKT